MLLVRNLGILCLIPNAMEFDCKRPYSRFAPPFGGGEPQIAACVSCKLHFECAVIMAISCDSFSRMLKLMWVYILGLLFTQKAFVACCG
jgi:hypothetical protein